MTRWAKVEKATRRILEIAKDRPRLATGEAQTIEVQEVQDNAKVGDAAPGHSGSAPGHGGTPPGQGGTPPGQTDKPTPPGQELPGPAEPKR